MDPWKHEFVQANGIKIHYVTAGKGPLVILLHGFPQFWYTWRHQIPFLAKHFQVVAPDLRGYGETERPLEVAAYNRHVLAEDVAGLIHALGHEKAHIVGHDWGGSVAWRTALDKPEVVDRLVILNSPHPYIFKKALSTNFRQLARSWYIFFFQIPYVPEFIFNSTSKNMLKELFRGSAIRKDAFSDDDLKIYQEAMEKPGAFTAALNYYRAAFRKDPEHDKDENKDKRIAAPTLVIWGEGDTALGKELTYGMEPLFSGPFKIEYVPNCSHWVVEEQPDLVNRLILEFLS